MTVPVPAPTDPGGDAALHIRNFAEGVEGRLTANLLTVVPFDTGNLTADANGDVWSQVASNLASITGAVFGLANPNGTYTPPNNDLSYPPWTTRVPHSGNVPNQLQLRSYNSNRASHAGRWIRLTGLMWGPAATAADAPHVQPAASQTFPPGQTPVYKIRYPGTDQAMSGAADAIHDMSTDIERATGGAPPTLAIVRRTVTLTTNTFGMVPEVYFTGELARVRGAVVTLVDPGDFVRRSRLTRVQIPNDTWQPSEMARINFTVYSNERDGSNRPLLMANETLKWNILAWGDKV